MQFKILNGESMLNSEYKTAIFHLLCTAEKIIYQHSIKHIIIYVNL